MLPLWFSQYIYFNINKKANYISMNRFCLSLENVRIVFVFYSSSVFPALVVSIHHLWFRFILIYGLQPGRNIYLRLSFLNGNSKHEEKGGWTLAVTLTRTASFDDRRLFVSPADTRCLFLVHVFTYLAISTGACSVSLDEPGLSSFALWKSNEIFLHTTEKRIVAYKNEIEEKSGQ